MFWAKDITFVSNNLSQASISSDKSTPIHIYVGTNRRKILLVKCFLFFKNAHQLKKRYVQVRELNFAERIWSIFLNILTNPFFKLA